jgi:hypothetical protein
MRFHINARPLRRAFVFRGATRVPRECEEPAAEKGLALNWSGRRIRRPVCDAWPLRMRCTQERYAASLGDPTHTARCRDRKRTCTSNSVPDRQNTSSTGRFLRAASVGATSATRRPRWDVTSMRSNDASRRSAVPRARAATLSTARGAGRRKEARGYEGGQRPRSRSSNHPVRTSCGAESASRSGAVLQCLTRLG